MTAILEPEVLVDTNPILSVDTSFLVPDENEFRERAATLVGLGTLAAFAFSARYNGVAEATPEGLKAVLESCAHPILGYIATWFSIEVVSAFNLRKYAKEEAPDPKPRKHVVGAAFAAATLLDLTAEQGQDIVTYATDAMSWRNNMPETAKDYIFALFGLWLFLKQNRRKPAGLTIHV